MNQNKLFQTLVSKEGPWWTSGGIQFCFRKRHLSHLDVPDGRAAAAISMAVAASGAARMKTIALLMPEEIDQPVKKPVHFEALS